MTFFDIGIHFRAVHCLVYFIRQTSVEVCTALSPAHLIDGGELLGLHQLKVCSFSQTEFSLFFPFSRAVHHWG